MQDTQSPTIQTVAQDAAWCFIPKARDDGAEYIALRESHVPEWVGELAFAVHGTDPDGSFLPDDYRYAYCLGALEWFAEGGDPDDVGEYADGAVDVYTGDRLRWLASHAARVGFCDEAQAAGLVAHDAEIVDRIGVGQYVEASEVAGIVVTALRDRIASLETRS